MHFTLHYQGGAYPVHFAIPGSYSVENALTAMGMALALEVPLNRVLEAVEAVKGICGRSEVLYSDSNMTVMRDYGPYPRRHCEHPHPPSKAMLKAGWWRCSAAAGTGIKPSVPKWRRRQKQYADFLVVTSDNPRSEDPDAIIDDVLAGLSPQRQLHSDHRPAERH